MIQDAVRPMNGRHGSAADDQAASSYHGLAIGIAVGLLFVWAAVLVATLVAASGRPDRAGALLAVFPRGISATEAIGRVALADGAVMSGSWFGNVWHVYGRQPDFAGRLLAQGAVFVLSPLPYAAFTVGGCGSSELTVTARGRPDLRPPQP
jgi:hypothetical protein